MLHLVLGRAGSGKTEYVRALLRERAADGGPLYLLVPEQYSFESERALLRAMGPSCRGVEVLSFTRLADRIQREYGGMAGRRLTESGRVLLMGQALRHVADGLELYRRQAENGDFVALMLQMAQECKQNGVEPARLLDAARAMEEGPLRRKAEETGLILTEYDALVSQSFLDPLDDLTRLKNQLASHAFFGGSTVVADSFKGFTAQEFEVLEAVIRQADDCVVTLCADRLDDPEHGMGLFSGVRKTARRLIELARRNSVPVASPVVLGPGKRFVSANLRALEGGVFRAGPPAAAEADGSVVLSRAANAYEEAAWIARTIVELVRGGEYRCRDFAVVTRRVEDAAGILDETLRRYGIPCFMDMPRRVDDSPLIAYALSAVETAAGGLEGDSLFRCLKTGLFGLSAEEIAALENYTFIWSIDRDGWLSEWKNHPDGFSDEMTDEDAERLRGLNALRVRVCDPLSSLGGALREGTGKTAATAIFRFLEQTDAAGRLTAMAEQLRADGRAQIADDQPRVWELLMELLDQLAAVLGGERLDGPRVLQLLQLAVSAAELGKLPQSLDEVSVGGAERMRPAGPRVVFVAGANQGVFPAPPGGRSVFSDAERDRLAAFGVELSQTPGEDAVEERFLAYTALCCASERLMVSWNESTVSGESLLPGEIVLQVRRCLPALETARCAADPDRPADAEEAARTLAAEYYRNTPRRAALLQAFSEREEYAPLLQALRRAAAGVSTEFEDAETAMQLFGKRLRLSPSRVESYYQCPFEYFCRYGLGASPRRQAKIDSLEYGTMIHYVLEQVLRARGGPDAEDLPTLGAQVHRILEEYLSVRLGGREDKSERFLRLFERFESVAVLLLQAILTELEQSAFVPADLELPIGPEDGEDGIPSLVLPLPDGGSIEVFGKVDRVDVMETDRGVYVRVIDYKTGGKRFALRDVLYGVNMQMLIYLLTIWKNGGERYGEVTPAGVLYMPARSPRIDGARGEAMTDTLQRRLAAMCMSGIVLDDGDAIGGMEPSRRGVFIPVRCKADGTPDARSQVISLARLGRLSRHVESLLRQMGGQLHQGRLPALPKEKACGWCSFQSVCGHGEDDPVFEIPPLCNREVFEWLDRVES